MKLFGRLQCFVKRKHVRGKFLRLENGKMGAMPVKIYACPRCGRETTYKTKVAKLAQDTKAALVRLADK